MYHPLLLFDGETDQLLAAVLRPGTVHASRGVVAGLSRVVQRIRNYADKSELLRYGTCLWAARGERLATKRLDESTASQPLAGHAIVQAFTG